ncbi:MAG: DMT family transporter [Woeseiaceae bacterium]
MDRLALFAWLALGVVWGSNFIFMKWATDYISPLQVVLARVIFGFLPVFFYALANKQLRFSHLRHGGHFTAMACLAAVVYYYGFAVGTSLLPSGIAGAVSGSIPLFSMIAAVALLPEERLNRYRVTGLLLGLLGVVMIARPFESEIDLSSAKGVLFIVIGSMSLGVSFVYARRFVVPLNLSSAALTTYQLGFASLILLLATPLTGIDAVLVDPRASAGLVVGLGLLGTGFAYILYYFIVSRLGAIGASTVTYLPPVVALLIGSTFVGEPIEWLDLVAATMILGGVFMMNQKPTKP